jgi:hypothetical protein
MRIFLKAVMPRIGRMRQPRDQAEGKDLTLMGMTGKLKIKKADRFFIHIGSVFEQE